MRVFRRNGSDVWWADHHAGGRRHRKSTETADKRKAEKKARSWAKELDEQFAVVRIPTMLSAAIKGFLQECEEAHLAINTVRGYRHILNRFLAVAGNEDISLWSRDAAFDKVTEFIRVRRAEVKNYEKERVVVGTFFNFAKSKRWYRGENPAGGKLHRQRKPRRGFVIPERRTTPEEDQALRREGHKSPVWPVLLLTRWAGMRRGEACAIRWSEIDLQQGCADVMGHEGGRKHPRRVWLAPWVVMQLRSMKPAWLPRDGDIPIWPHHPDSATELLGELCDEHLDRKISFNDLRASFATDCYEHGLSAEQESKIVGHSPEVANKHYLEYEAKEARHKLPDDPLTGGDDADPGAELDAKVAQ